MSSGYNFSTQIIYQNEKVEVLKKEGYLEIKYLKPHIIRIAVDNRMAVDNEVIRMLQMKDRDSKKYFIQKEVGKIIGVSRQMINRRWQVYKEEGLISLLKGEWKHSKITGEVLRRLGEISVENPFLTPKEIIEILKSEGICKEMSETTVYNAQQMLDGRKLIELMRKKWDTKEAETFRAFMGANYIVKKLFEIIESLFNKLKDKGNRENTQVVYEKSLFNYLKRYYQTIEEKKRGKYKRDKYEPRKKLKRDKKRIIRLIKNMLKRRKDMLIRCPDCGSKKIKFKFKRERYYIDKAGIKQRTYSRVYRCLNSSCTTKYFTIPPKGVELYARFHSEVKKMVLRWIFHLRGTLSRVYDELAENGIVVSISTVLRWIKKAGEESAEMLKISEREDFKQNICIDEKWIKIRSKWRYVFTAVGAEINDLLAIEVFQQKSKEAMRTFLLWLKLLGYRPRSITTDLLMGYEGVVKEIFPDSYYNQCVLHAERDAKRIVRENLTGEKGNKWKKILRKRIRILFASKRGKQVKKRYRKIMELKDEAPEEAEGVFKMIEKFYPKLYQSVIRNDIPKSTNAVERAIGEFEEKYHLTKGFTSFYYAQFFIKAYQVYYRLRKISFGIFKGKNRMELKENPIGKLKWTDYLVTTYC